MSRKRSDIEISADILRIAKDGARKSQIVYQANLNFKIANKYLTRLSKAGLIYKIILRVGPTSGGRVYRVYKTTEKGAKYLDHFEGFKDYMSWAGVVEDFQSKYSKYGGK